MLNNLKDGQVYISVDEVHQYLKNAGNTIAKETIQEYMKLLQQQWPDPTMH